MPGVTTTANTTATSTSMLGTTSSTIDTDTTMLETTILANSTTISAMNMDSNALERTCTTCDVKFATKDIRVHMREEWHIFNLKRRIDGLEPISQSTYQAQIRASPSPRSRSKSEKREVSFTSSEPSSASAETSSSEEEDDEQRSGEDEEEGDSEQDDDEAKDGTQQRHGNGAVRIGNDLCLPSGKILSHRSHARQSRRDHHPRQRDQPATLAPEASPSSSRSTSPLSSENIQLILSHRPSSPSSSAPRIEATPGRSALVARKGTETSLVGIAEKQQRALAVVARKMEASGQRTMSEFQDGVDRRGNCQKTFRVKSMGKKAGGLEKRLG